MENHSTNEFVTFAFSNIHNTIQENIVSHEEICDETTECILPKNLSELTDVNVNLHQFNDNSLIPNEMICDNNDNDNKQNNTIVYPLYLKEEEKQQQQQFTTGDESMAIEALSQLGGTYTPSSYESIIIKCMNCHEQFTQINYKNHIKFCNKNNLSCPTCNETFSRSTDLNNHIVCHQTDRPHSCRTCGNLYRTKTLLNSHMRTAHKSNKLYKCLVCDENFLRPSSLANHLKIHSYTPGRAIKNNNITYDILQNKLTDIDDNNFFEFHNVIDNHNEDIDDPITLSTSSINNNNNNNSNNNDLQNFETSTINTWPNSTYTISDNNQDTISTITNNDNDVHNAYELNTINEFTVLQNDDVTQTYEYTGTLPQQEQEQQQQQVQQGFITPENIINNNTNNNNDDDDDDDDDIILELDNDDEDDVDVDEKQDIYLCSKCGLNFKSISSLKNHEKIHTTINNANIDIDNVPIDCKYCDKQYENNQHLMIHHKTCIKKILDDNKNNINISNKYNKHACIECGKRFTTKQKMYRHQWIHRKKTWTCEQCGKQYEKQIDLDEHRLSMHLGDSPFTCNDCGKSFVSRQGLWEHSRTHAGNPAHFHCDICGKKFSSRQGYLIHHRSHTGERPYGCQYCWKAFRDGGTLRKHERIHTGERPHICPVCKRAFNQKVVLREHIRWVHAAAKKKDKNVLPPYPCPICNHLNQDRDELCAHIVKHSDEIFADAKAKSTNIQTTTTITTTVTTTTTSSSSSTTTTTTTNSSNNKKKPTKDKINKYENLKTNKGQLFKINNGTDDIGETLLLVTTDETDVDKTGDINENIDDNTCTITINNNNNTFILPCTSQSYQLHDNDLSALLIQSNNDDDNNNNNNNSNNENQTIHYICDENNTIQFIENNDNSNDNNNIPVIIDQTINYSDNDISEITIKNNDHSYEMTDNDAIVLIDSYDYHDNHDNNDDDDLNCKLCGDNFADKSILMEHIKIHTNVNTR